jgi:CubicO group peptidase (beta-lactamase class C family)
VAVERPAEPISVPDQADIAAVVERVANQAGFSGVVRVDRGDRTVVSMAFGLADRRHCIGNTTSTRFGIASGTKWWTALTTLGLVADGTIALDTTARSLLGADLPSIDDAVTVEHLLAHRSGIGDYLDESVLGDINDHVMPVPVHRLSSTEAYVPILDGHLQREPPGERFRYNNSGYVVLAVLAERASGIPFEQLVHDRVCARAGLDATGFVRGDELAPEMAVGYLAADGLRSNVLHLPALGSGDGGIVTTADDIHRLWAAWLSGAVLAAGLRDLMIQPHSEAPEHGMRYGLGCWLHPTSSTVSLEGMDAGVSFRTVHDPATGSTHTVLANTSSGAWPMTKALDETLGLS